MCTHSFTPHYRYQIFLKKHPIFSTAFKCIALTWASSDRDFWIYDSETNQSLNPPLFSQEELMKITHSTSTRMY